MAKERTALVRTVPVPTDGFDGFSVPTYRGSTITYPTYESFANRGRQHRNAYTYGLNGTPTTRTLQAKLTELESGVDTLLVPSGLMAITTAVLALTGHGDTVLFPDTVYPPVRRFARDTLPRFGVGARFYNPTDIGERDLEDSSVRLIWVESPGSTTMEVQDLPAICALAA
ncbi:MAG: PLP-dependent transferase, partial [Rhodospirillales bacterium]|nr:PLP-dependent transferase [Rhodospirillales bacterium]